MNLEIYFVDPKFRKSAFLSAGGAVFRMMSPEWGPERCQVRGIGD